MFSIIIPLYNKAAYILETLHSVFNQTFARYEVIVVDDGSTDDGVDLIEHHFGARVRIIRQENQGVSAARNNGVRAAVYDHVAFLDADDLLHPKYLEEHYNAWQKYKEVAIIGSKYKKIMRGTAVENDPVEKDTAAIVEHYFENAGGDFLFWTSSVTIKKEVFDTVGFFNGRYAAGEDLDIWFKTMFYFKGVYIPQILAYYVDSENQYKNEFNLPPLNRHLAGNILKDYKPLIVQGNKSFNDFIHRFILKFLLLYYFDKRYKKEAVVLYKKVPGKYKKNYVGLMYTLPYNLARKLFFWKINK